MAKIKTDLHNHFSTLENFGDIFNQVINTAQRNLGRGGIFGVINAQDEGIGRYETLLRQGGRKVKDLDNAFYVPNKDIYAIKGQEVFTQDGHILVLGLNHKVKLKDYRSLEDSLKEAKDHNAIIIADHCFFIDGIFYKKISSKYLKDLDGIEIHNGKAWLPTLRCINSNKKAQLLYKIMGDDFNIGAISTSDGHSIKEIGMSYTILEQPDFSSPERLIESLRKSIREHKDWSDDKQTNAYFPTLKHSVKVAGLRILSKSDLIGRVN